MAVSETTAHQSDAWGDGRLLERLVWGGFLIWSVMWAIWSWGYWEDDSYIHLGYARSVSQGLGFVFNGVTSNGDTSPLWVLALSVFGSLAPDWVQGGKVMSIITLLVSLWILFVFIRRLLPTDGQGVQGIRPVLLGLVFTSPFTLHWAYSGMEAVSASAWLVGMSMCLGQERPSWRDTVRACLLVGLGPLLRPEFVLMGPVALSFLWRHMQTVWQDNPPAMARFKLLFGALLLVAPLALWALYAWHAFGYVLPNTNAAKRAAPGVMVPWRMGQLFAMGFPMLLLACAGLAWSAWRSKQMRKKGHAGEAGLQTMVSRVAWPLLAWCGIVMVFYVINHTHVQTRYILVLGPGLTIVGWATLARYWGAKAVLPWLLLGLLGTGGVSWLWLKPLIDNKIVHDRQVAQMAQFIRDQVPPQAPIAVYSIGQYGFLLPNPIVDIGGITQPGAVPYLFGPASDMVAWARRQGAQYYISGAQPEPDATLIHHLAVPLAGEVLKPGTHAEWDEIKLWRLRMP